MPEPSPLVLSEPQLGSVAGTLASRVGDGGVIYLSGDLGAGKTTFARAMLGALGVTSRIKSPTYSLIESYTAGDLIIHHLDLYRIEAADELHWIGLEDLGTGKFLMLVEWPERGTNALPPPDLHVKLAHAGTSRRLDLQPASARGAQWLSPYAITALLV